MQLWGSHLCCYYISGLGGGCIWTRVYWETGGNSLDTAWCFLSYMVSQDIIFNQEVLLLSIVHLLKKEEIPEAGEEAGRCSAWNYLPWLYIGKRYLPKVENVESLPWEVWDRRLIFIEAGKDGKIILFSEQARSKNLKFSLVYKIKLEAGQFID